MSIIAKIRQFFGAHKQEIITVGLAYAESRGLTPEVAALALKWVKVAETTWQSNTDRRNWVVDVLVRKSGLSESVARTAVEIAVQALQAEAAKAGQ